MTCAPTHGQNNNMTATTVNDRAVLMNPTLYLFLKFLKTNNLKINKLLTPNF